MQITLGDFNFIYQFGPISYNLNKTITTSFCLVQKQERLSPLRTLFARQQSFKEDNIFSARTNLTYGPHKTWLNSYNICGPGSDKRDLKV